MSDSIAKKENTKKKKKKIQDKQLRREVRKDSNNKGKNLNDMIVYVDINGHFTSVPPNLQNRDADWARAKKTKELTTNEKEIFSRIINYLSDKGFGFITEDETGENVFFHIDQANYPIEKHIKVSYKKEMTTKGCQATDIKK